MQQNHDLPVVRLLPRRLLRGDSRLAGQQHDPCQDPEESADISHLVPNRCSGLESVDMRLHLDDGAIERHDGRHTANLGTRQLLEFHWQLENRVDLYEGRSSIE